jgi:hypothetical protein
MSGFDTESGAFRRVPTTFRESMRIGARCVPKVERRCDFSCFNEKVLGAIFRGSVATGFGSRHPRCFRGCLLTARAVGLV